MRSRIAPVVAAAMTALLSGLVACGGGGDGGSSQPDPVPALTVLSPDGGDAWFMGNAATVTWETTDFVGNLDIEVSSDGGVTWGLLVTNTPDDGSEVVTVPMASSSTMRIRVSATDGDSAVTLPPTDTSDANFSVQTRILLTHPDDGGSWWIGSTETVTWDGTAYLGNVDIEYSTDSGLTWTTLVVNTTNDGTEDVRVPQAPSPTVRVQVSAADGNPAVALPPSDQSEADFHIGGPWVDIEAGLTPLRLGYHAVAWGDFDSDGALDLALEGQSPSGPTTRIYRNVGGTFVDIDAGLPGVWLGALEWADFDNDGDLDLALSGQTGSGVYLARIYRNDDGTFVDIEAGLPGVNTGALAWGDFDNDGDLDLAMAGWDGGQAITRLYRNDGGQFRVVPSSLSGVHRAALAWGDYDGDGDVDLALAGDVNLESTQRMTRLYRNDGGVLTDLPVNLPGLKHPALAWGDCDNDGDLDLALAGNVESGGLGLITRIYRNDSGSFIDTEAGLPGVAEGGLDLGDFDNDGDLDLVIAGGGIFRIYRNDDGTYADAAPGLPPVASGDVAWGDYDRDGDLDLALVGGDLARIYRNDGGFFPNTPPPAPTDVRASSGGGEVMITWIPSDDAETPEEGLSYNLRVGLTPTDATKYPSMADEFGFRTIPARGPIASNSLFVSAWLTLPPGETYYASVQAVDAGHQGGPWSDPVRFTVPFDRTSADLSGLSATAGAITPTFDPDTLVYGISSSTLPESTTITATTADPEATVKINGITTASGTPSEPILLPAGLTTTTVTLEVTARDGIAHWTYTIVFTRTAPGGTDSGGGGGTGLGGRK